MNIPGAIIDGMGFAGRYWKIIIPLSKPGLVTAGTFIFLFSWNEFIYALLLTSRPQSRTPPRALGPKPSLCTTAVAKMGWCSQNGGLQKVSRMRGGDVAGGRERGKGKIRLCRIYRLN